MPPDERDPIISASIGATTMADAPKILAFAGSTREKSFNKMLVKIAAGAAEKAGAQVTYLDLRDLPMPIYDGDLEEREGLPANARKLKELMIGHHGLLISSAEYNSPITAVLKNAIDWASRPAPGEAPLAAFAGKVAALMSASPGALGGLRGLVHVRAILGNIGVLVLPDQLAISKAGDAFDDDGNLKDKTQDETVKRITAKQIHVINRLAG